MSSISPLTTANILPPTIPTIGPSLSSESEDEGDHPEREIEHAKAAETFPGPIIGQTSHMQGMILLI